MTFPTLTREELDSFRRHVNYCAAAELMLRDLLRGEGFGAIVVCYDGKDLSKPMAFLGSASPEDQLKILDILVKSMAGQLHPAPVSGLAN